MAEDMNVNWLLRVKGMSRKIHFLSVGEDKKGKAGVCLGGESWAEGMMSPG